MDDPVNPSAPPWVSGPSAKRRNAVQRNVTALLDVLAPEQTLTRREAVKVAVAQHRAPNGCVLQAATAALSVSWFEDDSPALGELHLIVWSGVLSRRGAPVQRHGATIRREIVLRPIDPPNEGRVWRGTDGTEYDTPSLAGYCVALLDEEMAS